MATSHSGLAEQFHLLQPAGARPNVNYLTQVQAGFVFKSEPSDDQFFFLHIEPLLDQAADLLDRGHAQRSSWDSLAVQMTEQWIELSKFAEEDKIRLDEEAAGIHGLPGIEASGSAEAEKEAAKHQAALSDQVQRIVDNYYSGDAVNAQLDAIRKGAFLSGVAAYEYKGQQFVGYINHTYRTVKGEDISGRVQDFALQSAEAAGKRSLLMQKDEAVIQSRAYRGAAAVSTARLPSLEARLAFAKKSADFSKARVNNERSHFELRQIAATAPDGALNFSRRLSGIRERFNQDFRDGLARLKSIQPGLKQVYGYELVLPSDETAVDFFDACLLETRKALQWLIRFCRFDQTSVVPVSLRQLVGEAQWQLGLASYEWNFSLAPYYFEGMHLVRLRGLTAFASFAKTGGIVGISVNPPKQGLMTSDRGSVTLDQSRLPACRLFRVQERQANRDSDVVGVALLHNASPIGDWRVKVVRMPSESLTDLSIDLLVNYRAVPGAM